MKISVKAVSVFLAAAFIISLLSGCSSGSSGKTGLAEKKYPLVTELADKDTLNEVCSSMESAGLSNVDMFRGWVEDFTSTAGENAFLTKGWVAPSEIKSDIYACMDGWEKNHDFSDADCRMTAFLLLDGIIKAEKTDKIYSGTYLMFDVEAIDSVEKYEVIKKNRALFTTVFGEKNKNPGMDDKDVFPMWWKDNEISVSNDKVSLISVVMVDPTESVLFVGHTGVLIDCGDYKLFVEKLAFEQPYRVTKLDNIEQLIEIFNSRDEYFETEDHKGTFFYKNGKIIDVSD